HRLIQRKSTKKRQLLSRKLREGPVIVLQDYRKSAWGKKLLPSPWPSSGDYWRSSCPCARRRLKRSSPLWPGSNGAITACIFLTKSGVRRKARSSVAVGVRSHKKRVIG